MKVFISWSGERSQQLAQALRDWIPLVLYYVEPWLSDVDVSAGERWAQAIAKELDTSNFGIISVTRENVSAPWILFEAGSLAKSLEESRVIPVLLDLDFSEIGGPLAQFQAKKADRNGLSEVIQSINKAEPKGVPDDRASQLFDHLWPSFQEKLETIPDDPGGTRKMRPQTEVLEELVAVVRSVESRIREVEELAAAGGIRRRRGARLARDPFVFRELAAMMADRPGDPITLLLAASFFKEDFPWLYELGVDAYRAATAGTPEEARSCMRRFHRAAELLAKGPFAREFGYDPREIMLLLEHDFDAYSSRRTAEVRRRRREVSEAEEPTS